LQRLVALVPADAALSASVALVPHVSQRPKLYVFPALLDADFVLLDVTTSPAPISAGDVFLRVRTMLADGSWSVRQAEDGFQLLQRAPVVPPVATDDLPPAFYTFAHAPPGDAPPVLPVSRTFFGGALELVSGEMLPSPDAGVEPDGPRGILRTTWRVNGPLPASIVPVFYLAMDDGSEVAAWEGAETLWWHPVERWRRGETVRIDLPSIPLRRVTGWRATVEARPGGEPVPLLAAPPGGEGGPVEASEPNRGLLVSPR
jgi:hypothetical protein